MKVTLTRDGNVIHIEPFLSEFKELLTCKRKHTDILPGSRGKMTIRWEREALYTQDGSVGLTYGGFLSRLRRYCKQSGIETEVVDVPASLPDPDLTDLPILRKDQDGILATLISSNRGGVIVGPPALGKTFIIEQMCRMYHSAKILVITPRIPVLKEIHNRIKTACPGSIISLVSAGNLFNDESTVAVCSAGSLHKIDPDWPDILIFDEVHNAAAPEVSSVLAEFTKPKMFGFTASPSGRGDSAELIIEAFFGPVIYNVSYEDAVENKSVVPIKVRIVTIECPEVKKTFPIAKERHNIWRNYTRNKEIQRIARLYPTEKVLIMTKTVEHALYIRQMLPEFTLVHAGISDDKFQTFTSAGLLREDDTKEVNKDQIQKDFKEGKITKVISTMTWREGVDFPDLSVLIRADGSAGEIPAIQITGRLSRVAQGKQEGVLVDFYDSFGTAFERRSKERIKHYKKQGWEISYDGTEETV